MNRDSEERLLGLAVARGVLSLEEAAAASRELSTPRDGLPVEASSRVIESLVASGRLELAAVAGLEHELSGLEETSRLQPTLAALPNRESLEALVWSQPWADGAAERLPTPAVVAGRYQVVEVLGRGGMGTVCKAWEPVLRRHVAIKFLRSDAPDIARRFALEAQAQARVDHEHVCKVFDVGEADGRPYIVMQYIDGMTLRALREQLTLEDKLLLMKSVAEAVHAANRIGLIHRDIKPGNIMVERSADGVLRPYVLDFGLAQDQQAPGLTRTGMIMGTPAYMAPEQARGEAGALSRRTDVWGLGVVLFELLAGETPYVGGSDVELLMKLLNEEPRRLRTLVTQVPADLETIVMKCLERDPARRYESARALAEDLGRFLAGEPIAARPASWAYLVARKARKYRALVAVSAVSLLTVTTLLGVGLWGRHQAAERARLAQRFGGEVERLEGFLRYAFSLPLHDTRREKAVLREGMAAIAAEMERLGSLAIGPGHFALGRGHLALDEPAAARRDLELAWAAGQRTPETAYALGLTLGRLYQAGLLEAGRIPVKEMREARREQLGRELRDPALAALRRAAGASTLQPAYVEGLIAFYEGRNAEALEHAKAAYAAAPWLYEAIRLQGDVHLAVASAGQEKGDVEGALSSLARAREAYERAAAIARSDSAVLVGASNVFAKAVEIDVARGRDPAEPFAKALTLVDAALDASPDSVDGHSRKAALFQRRADAQLRHGEDPTAALDQMIASAEEAVRLSGGLEGHQFVGAAYLIKAMHVDAKHGRDPIPSLELAAASLDKALAVRGDFPPLLINAGSVRAVHAERELALGRDPRPYLEQARQLYRKALSSGPETALLLNNLGVLSYRQGEWEAAHGADPRPAFTETAEVCRRALAINPEMPQVLNLLGATQEAGARFDLAHGRDPRAALDAAIDANRKALGANPTYAYAHNNLGTASLLRARWERATGGHPGPWLVQAVENASLALKESPAFVAEGHANLAEAHALAAAVALDAGSSPETELRLARQALDLGAAVNPSFPAALVQRGRVELLAARWARRAGRPAEPALAASRQALERVLAVNPGHLEACTALGELALVEAEQRGAADAARETALKSGLAAAEKALAIDPGDARAGAVKGALTLASARTTPDASARAALAREAADLLARALADNPLLEHEFGLHRLEAERLAGGAPGVRVGGTGQLPPSPTRPR